MINMIINLLINMGQGRYRYKMLKETNQSFINGGLETKRDKNLAILTEQKYLVNWYYLDLLRYN